MHLTLNMFSYETNCSLHDTLPFYCILLLLFLKAFILNLSLLLFVGLMFTLCTTNMHLLRHSASRHCAWIEAVAYVLLLTFNDCWYVQGIELFVISLPVVDNYTLQL